MQRRFEIRKQRLLADCEVLIRGYPMQYHPGVEEKAETSEKSEK